MRTAMTIYYACDDTVSENVRKVEVVQQDDQIIIAIDGTPHVVDAIHVSPSTLSIIHEQKSYRIKVIPCDGGYATAFNDREQVIKLSTSNPRHRTAGPGAHKSGRTEIRSPMPGKVVDVLVSIDQSVEASQGLVIIEAMKMENEIKSPVTGTVKEINVTRGDTVSGSQVLIIIV